MATQRATSSRRTEKLDLRVSRAAKVRLQAAAAATHSSLSDFVLEGALARAEEVLADRRSFLLTEDKWVEFLQALDSPVRPLPRMKALLAESAPFESDSDQ